MYKEGEGIQAFVAYSEKNATFATVFFQTSAFAMFFKYIKPQSEPVELYQESAFCAESQRDGNLQDYYQDNENNFFGGL